MTCRDGIDDNLLVPLPQRPEVIAGNQGKLDLVCHRPLVLRIEAAHQLPGHHPVANAKRSFNELAVDAEGEVDLLLCADLAGERNKFADGASFDSNRANGANLDRWRR